MINDIIEKTVRFYSERETPVHITKHDKEWMNGFIIEVGADFLVLNEFKKHEVVIFFKEILNVETFTKVGG